MDDSIAESPSSSLNGNIYENKMNNRSPGILQMAKNFVVNLKSLFNPPGMNKRRSPTPSDSSNLLNNKKEDVYYNNHETFEISDIFNGNSDNVENEIIESESKSNDTDKLEEIPKVSPYTLIKKPSNKTIKRTPPSKEENIFFSPMIIKKIDYNISPNSSNNTSSPNSPYVMDSHLFSYRSPFKKKSSSAESTPLKYSPQSNGTSSSELRRKRKKIVKETKKEDNDDIDEFDIMPIAKKKKHIDTDFNSFRKHVLNKNLPSPKTSMGFLKDFQPFVNTDFEDEFESPEEKLDAQLEKFMEIKKRREEMEKKYLEKSLLLEEKQAKLLEEREKIEKSMAENDISSTDSS